MAGAAGKRKKQGAASGSADKKQRQEAEGAPDAEDEEAWEGEVEEDDEDEEEEACGGALEEEEDEEEDEADEGRPRHIWRPGVDELEDGEQLDVEPGTYDMLHRAQVEWPCLSFDVVKDDLGAQRSAYPMTAYVVAGTQAKEATDNRLYMMKWSKLYKTLKDGKESEEEESSGGESEDEHEAMLDHRGAMHPGGVNRVRAMPQAPHIVASWSDSGKVMMWNLQAHRKALDRVGDKAPLSVKPIHTCDAHKEEGFAMDFSPHETGKFLSGSNDGAVLLWEPVQGGWRVDEGQPFSGHTSSVEDVQWRRTGVGAQSTFASCSSDRSIRVWDVREKSRKSSAAHIKDAHAGDVNVISWSPCVGELLMSGGDDGGFKVWDVRNIGAGAMANFQWHRKPVTSVDWHPTDETVLAVASEDNSVSLWDMAVEDDRPEGQEEAPGENHYPAQMLFLHMGQQDIKELRWHPQLPGVCITTAGSGFNIFKTCNI